MSGIPDRGDIGWVEFDPQSGREQAGRRPALVISPAAYNGRSGLMLVCPLTRKIKGYPFEVPLPPELLGEGVILCDHLRSIDWRARKFDFIAHAPQEVLKQVVERLEVLIILEQGKP